jgi:hypothetical protein
MVVDNQNANWARLIVHDFSSVSFPENFASFSASHDRCPSGTVYARTAGMLSSTSVPASSSLHTVSLPPMSLARDMEISTLLSSVRLKSANG